MLKYVEVMATEQNQLIEYIRFKKDIDEDDRNRIKRAGLPMHPFEEVIESDIPSDATINCVLAWQVYFIKCVVNRIEMEKEPSGVFERNSTWKKLKLLIHGAYPNETTHLKKILPTIRKGNIKLNAGPLMELDLDLEWEDKTEGIMNFSAFAKKVISMYEELTAAENTCFVLIDELELVYLKKKKYERDVALIRDLIQAVYYMNEISKRHGFHVRIIACIRNEVYRSISAIGMELNKMIQDYGVEISWVQHGGSISEHPLIKMLNNRLWQSQCAEVRKETNSVWDVYFDEHLHVNGRPVMNYIIEQTWNKPRDITRLFMLLQKRAEGNAKIGKADFEAVRSKYSEEAWEEFSNELSAKYSREEVGGIKQLLTGIALPFTVQEFAERMNEEGELFEEVLLLNKRRKPADILLDLYKIGIVGNDGWFNRFIFKGNENFDPLSACTIHYPLRKFFTTRRKEGSGT